MRVLLVAERTYMAAALVHALYASGHSICEIWTQFDPARLRRKSTSRLITRKPRCVGTLIGQHNIPLRLIDRQTSKNPAAILSEFSPADTLISAATNIIFNREFLANFGVRAFNFHPSLLPYYRGPRPQVTMIIRGQADIYGGMTLHQLAPGIDEGDIIGQRVLPRSDFDNALGWILAHADAAGELVETELDQFLNGPRKAIPQDEANASYHNLADTKPEIDESWTFIEAYNYLSRGHYLFPASQVSVKTGRNQMQYLAVTDHLVTIGKPTMAPPLISSLIIEMDLMDARVQFTRERFLQRLVRKKNRYKTLYQFRK
jgi:methionyl-tRNA formyltransferase